MGRIFIIIGIVIIVIGLLLQYGNKIPIGKLPGDFVIRRENITIYFPLATGIILSIILTVIINVIFRFFK
jgi:hypothetical protein